MKKLYFLSLILTLIAMQSARAGQLMTKEHSERAKHALYGATLPCAALIAGVSVMHLLIMRGLKGLAKDKVVGGMVAGGCVFAGEAGGQIGWQEPVSVSTAQVKKLKNVEAINKASVASSKTCSTGSAR